MCNVMTAGYLFIFLLFSVCLSSLSASGATINASSCSQSSVQSAVSSANNGDNIIVPRGTCTWTSAVVIPGSKGITLNGGGNTIITGTLDVTPNIAATTRVTGFTFHTVNNAILTHGCGGLASCGGVTSATFRIDHNTLDGGGIMVIFDGNAPGLFDHNTVSTNAAAAEMLHNVGMGPNDASGWLDSVQPGGPNMLFVEDNNFTNNASSFRGTSAMQNYYGARVVFRHNTLTFCQFDAHGHYPYIGTRWWEIYENTFKIPANANQSSLIYVWGGTGVIYNNHVTGGPNTGLGNIYLYNDGPGPYPNLYQIGRGHAQKYSPTYVWGNDQEIPVTSGSSYVQLGRDYFVSGLQPSSLLRQESALDTSTTSYQYVAYSYPHPLQAGSTGAPNPPTGLSAIVQ